MPHLSKYPRDMKNFSVPANDAVRRPGNCRLILNTMTRCRPGPKSAVRTVMPLHRSLLSSTATYDLNGHRPSRNPEALVLIPMQHYFHHVAATLKTSRLSPGRFRAAIIVPIIHLDAVSSPKIGMVSQSARQPSTPSPRRSSSAKALPRATTRSSGSKHCSPYFRHFLLNDKSIVIQGSHL
jgi:hypothetical protein